MFLSLPMAAFNWHSLILEAEEEGERKKILWYISGQIYWRLCAMDVAGALRVLMNSGAPLNLCLWRSGDRLGGKKKKTKKKHNVLSRLVSRCRSVMNVLCLVRPQCAAFHRQQAQNDGGCARRAANGLKSPSGPIPGPWNRLRPLSQSPSHISNLSKYSQCSYTNWHFGTQFSTQGQIIPAQMEKTWRKKMYYLSYLKKQLNTLKATVVILPFPLFRGKPHDISRNSSLILIFYFPLSWQGSWLRWQINKQWVPRSHHISTCSLLMNL